MPPHATDSTFATTHGTAAADSMQNQQQRQQHVPPPPPEMREAAHMVAVEKRDRYASAHEQSEQVLMQYLIMMNWWEANVANSNLAAATVAVARSTEPEWPK